MLLLSASSCPLVAVLCCSAAPISIASLTPAPCFLLLPSALNSTSAPGPLFPAHSCSPLALMVVPLLPTSPCLLSPAPRCWPLPQTALPLLPFAPSPALLCIRRPWRCSQSVPSPFPLQRLQHHTWRAVHSRFWPRLHALGLQRHHGRYQLRGLRWLLLLWRRALARVSAPGRRRPSCAAEL